MALTNEDIINAVSEMSVMQVVELIKAMEEKNDGLFDYDGTEEPTWAK